MASQRASGEAVKVALPLSQIPAPWQLRAAEEYDFEDDDDWEEEDELDGVQVMNPSCRESQLCPVAPHEEAHAWSTASPMRGVRGPAALQVAGIAEGQAIAAPARPAQLGP